MGLYGILMSRQKLKMEKLKIVKIKNIKSNLKPLMKMSDPKTLHKASEEEIKKYEEKNKKKPIETKSIKDLEDLE